MNQLARGTVATRLPARDLARARRFYSEVLGLDPVDERPGGRGLPGHLHPDGVGGRGLGRGHGRRAAWFHDSEGNLLGIGQPTR